MTSFERGRLESFRRVAKQVREASIIAQGQRIELHTAPGAAGYVDVFVGLLRDEPLRSLALAIRLVYQQNEPAHFYSVSNLLYREGTEEVQAKVDAIRAQYAEALADTSRRVIVYTETEAIVFTTKEVFDHWLYGVAFHQDVDRQPSVRLLSSTGFRFTWSLQATSLQLAGRILDLDDVVRTFLEKHICLVSRLQPSRGRQRAVSPL